MSKLGSRKNIGRRNKALYELIRSLRKPFDLYFGYDPLFNSFGRESHVAAKTSPTRNDLYMLDINKSDLVVALRRYQRYAVNIQLIEVAPTRIHRSPSTISCLAGQSVKV